jgi:hypothetical protein
MNTQEQEIPQEYQFQDCGENTIKCSDCNKPLIHYRVVVPDAPLAHKLQATCPFCNGQSFVHEVKGHIYTGPIGKDESVNPTQILDIETDRETGYSKFKLGKAQ